MNVVVISGNVCTEPHFWLSRKSKPMLSFVLAARRDPSRPQKRQREADFLPVVLSGRAAEELLPLLQVRTRLAVRGFVQSRNYTRHQVDGTQTRHTTLEVLAERIELVTGARGVAAEEPSTAETADNWDAALSDDQSDGLGPDWDTVIGPVRLSEEVPT